MALKYRCVFIILIIELKIFKGLLSLSIKKGLYMISYQQKTQCDLNCSVQNLISASFPMILSGLSATFMLLLDRIMLSHYSCNSMNAAFSASQALDLFVLPLLSFATISEVFVGQFNGSKQFLKTSIPIGQIALFLCCCWAVICPIAIANWKILLPEEFYEDGYDYFFIGMLTIPFQIIFSSISAFFVGIRRPQIILYGVFIANIVNILLDWIFIFGFLGIPAMGAKGAALASLIAMALSAFLLLWLFIRPENSIQYGTKNFVINRSILNKNIAIGAPYAFSEFVEMIIWVELVKLLARISLDYVTIQTVCITLWIFLMFITDGLQKGVMALASNCIGAQKEYLIKQLVKSMLKLTGIFALIAAFPLLIFSDQILFYGFSIVNKTLLPTFKIALLLLWIVMTMLMMTTSCLGGILSSGGDTKFITYIKVISILFCVALPIAWFYHKGTLTALTSWWLSIVQQGVNGVFFYWRYKSQKWKKISFSNNKF